MQLQPSDINGRLFTYAFVGFTGGNQRPVYTDHYYTTTDGYRYKQSLNGLDPNGYTLYANSLGFLDNEQPLYKDIRGKEATGDLSSHRGYFPDSAVPHIFC